MPEIGSTCFAIGNPRGLTQTLSIGNISGYRDGENWIQTTTEITHGSSGGPLFNSSGQVIGITSRGLDVANLNFAINIHLIPFEKYITGSVSFSDDKATFETAVKKLIKTYFNAILTGDDEKIRECYSQTLERYYSKFNITEENAIIEDNNYKRANGIVPVEFLIDWNNINITPDGNYYNTVVPLMYEIKRKNPDKPTGFKLIKFIKINSQMKICSIHEKIIQEIIK